MNIESRQILDRHVYNNHERGLYVPEGYDTEALNYLHSLDSVYFKPQNMLCANTLQLVEIAMLTERYANDAYSPLFQCFVYDKNPDTVLTIPDVRDIMRQRRNWHQRNRNCNEFRDPGTVCGAFG